MAGNSKVELKIFVKPYICFSLRGIKKVKKYFLSDFAYGELLIFEKGKPKYYLNLFEEQNYELMEYIENNNVTMYKLVTALFQIPNLNSLSLSQDNICKFGITIPLYKNEDSEVLILNSFSIESWKNLSSELKEKLLEKAKSL